jgi:hypothetical protein
VSLDVCSRGFDAIDKFRPRGGWTRGRPDPPTCISSMLICDVVLWCDLDSGVGPDADAAADCDMGSTLTPASLKVGWEKEEVAGVSTNLEEALLDQVLKWAGGGRDPVGRAGRLLRRSCK